MFPHEIFFFSALFFIAGVFLKSVGAGYLILLIVGVIAFFCLAFGLIKKRKKFILVAPLTLLIIVGAFYYAHDDVVFRKNVAVISGEKISISGFVDRNPKHYPTYTEFVLRVQGEYLKGRVLVRTESYKSVLYGDSISVSGTFERPEGSYAKYLEKERIHGIIAFPKGLAKIGEGEGSKIKAQLYKFKNQLEDSFSKYFSPKSSAFLGGITLGSKAGFDKNFREALQRSGTSHIVALSGYNITILASVTMSMFIFIFKRRMAAILTTMVIIGFVIMTGAEASVVRAAVLAFIIIFAKEYGRAHDTKNAIMLAALIMILINPKVLVFDLGFQLSFLAFIGIIYVKPAIENLFGLDKDLGFLGWRKNLLETFSAQLAVSPLLISQFGFVSLISILANLLVLSIVPLTMYAGFIIAFLDLVLPIAAKGFSFLIQPLLGLEFFIIETASRFYLPISPTFHWVTIAIYYLLVLALIYYARNIRKLFSRV